MRSATPDQHQRPAWRARPGAILPAMIGLLVLLELLAVSIVAMAHHERVVSGRRLHTIEAQLAARSAASRISLEHPNVQTLAPGGILDATPAHDPDSVAALIERLAPNLFVLRTTADAGPAGRRARAWAGLALIAFDPQSTLYHLRGALNSAGDLRLEASALVDGLNASLVPADGHSEQCRTWLMQPDSTPAIALAPGAVAWAHPAASVLGAALVEEWGEPGSTIFELAGGIPLAQLAARADRHESGPLRLAPVTLAGQCHTTTEGNWGAPHAATHPCAAYWPLIHSAGSLTINEGGGQGFLFVEGDLSLAAGAFFRGLVLVTGSLHLEAGATMEGAVLVRSPAHQGSTIAGVIRRSNCALARALTLPAALNRLAPHPARAWIPAF